MGARCELGRTRQVSAQHAVPDYVVAFGSAARALERPCNVPPLPPLEEECGNSEPIEIALFRFGGTMLQCSAAFGERVRNIRLG